MDDLPQAIFQRAIPAIGIRMEALDQLFVAEPDRRGIRSNLKRERLIGFLGERPDPRPLGLGLLAGLFDPGIIKEVKGVNKDLFRLLLRAPFAARSVFAHLPSRPMTDHRVFLVGKDRGIAHSSEIIVRLVIFPHVIDAELPETAFFVAALRRPVRPRFQTSRMLATRRLRFGASPAASRRYADLVIEFRLGVHSGLIIAPAVRKQVLRGAG